MARREKQQLLAIAGLIAFAITIPGILISLPARVWQSCTEGPFARPHSPPQNGIAARAGSLLKQPLIGPTLASLDCP